MKGREKPRASEVANRTGASAPPKPKAKASSAAKVPAAKPAALAKAKATSKAATGEARDRSQPATAPTARRAAKDGVDVARRELADGWFPVVGIGASAGGLEALEAFMRHVPDASGMAFVVVQHLDPTREGMMAELLQRSTAMKVSQIEDRTRVVPDHVYVIPPNKDLSILHGVLHLLAPTARRAPHLPIDFFFRSLADDQRFRSLGVILSGMGSDGTLGLGAIKERAGAAFVQSPASAKFDAMPRSAIDAGHADVVAPVEELPGKIAAYLAHAPLVARTRLAIGEKTQSVLDKICVVLRSHTGHDFSHYKQGTVHRRIERRMGLHQIASIGGYLRYLQEDPGEAQLLFKELLIGVTSFFRDPTAWEHLRTTALPALLRGRARRALRAWVPGCSTGEEAFSLAIAFKEALDELHADERFTLQLFATDLDGDAIQTARQGVYRPSIAGDVSEERLRRFFVEDDRGYRVKSEIREMVIFAPQDVLMQPPFTKLDIASCRNLLIYLSPAAQKKLLRLFHYCLEPGGLLFLGNAETVGAASDLFVAVDRQARMYRRLESSVASTALEFPSSFPPRPSASDGPSATGSVPDLQTVADRLLLERYAPAAVFTNDQGDILYVSGRTGRYLEPAPGKANWNVVAMAREGLRQPLEMAFQKALRQRCQVVEPQVKLGRDDAEHAVTITVAPLGERAALGATTLVVFQETAALPATEPGGRRRQSPAAGGRAGQEALRLRQELQVTREQMQASQEELKSANEELQSTNEELQSTNEELTTSKEELQSLNEELQTVNHELQAKVDDLSLANDDMRNLLDSTDIATLFLDDALQVRRFTARMEKIFRLRPSDVGRSITDLASDLVYPALGADTREVLRTLVFKETPVETVDGRWFDVRIMPYRTVDNRIEGAVITFVDITTAKKLEAALRQQPGQLEEGRDEASKQGT